MPYQICSTFLYFKISDLFSSHAYAYGQTRCQEVQPWICSTKPVGDYRVVAVRCWCWVTFRVSPANLKNSGARAYCACSRCRWGCFGIFFSLAYHFSFPSPSLWETARYRLKYCLKTTNPPVLEAKAFHVEGRTWISIRNTQILH